MLRGSIAVVLLIVWMYQITYPPPPKICGSRNGPPVTAPRIKLRDGRHLAYKENGVPRDAARFKVIFIHGFFSCRHDPVITFPPEVYQQLQVHILSFDRPGYGESDPDPNRNPKSLALDVEELADQLGLGPKFYVVGFSMGGQAVWGCLNYIPHRVAGATLIAPAVNYWWPGFPANLSTQAYKLQLPRDQWTLGVSHYVPWLTYWWNSQNWFPSSGVAAGHPDTFSTHDVQIRTETKQQPDEVNAYIIQQGKYEALHRDMMVGFGSWEFDPMDIQNPFPNNEGSVQLWQGDEDRMVPVILQRYIAEKLPWITYHELAGAGHLFPFIPEQTQAILTALLSPLSSSSEV